MRDGEEKEVKRRRIKREREEIKKVGKWRRKGRREEKGGREEEEEDMKR